MSFSIRVTQVSLACGPSFMISDTNVLYECQFVNVFDIG